MYCAARCVFCWRHHTNPVGKEWKWNMDSAREIIETGIEKHTKMIHEFKGVPGVKEDRLIEGYKVQLLFIYLLRPIMY